MKKRFTLVAVGCALALSAMAHRDIFLTQQLPISTEENWNKSAWTASGAVRSVDDGGIPYFAITGDYLTDNGALSCEFVYDARSNAAIITGADAAFLYVAATDGGTEAHVTPRVVVADMAGEEVTYHFAALVNDPDDLTPRMVESTSVEGDPSSLGTIASVAVYFDNVTDYEGLIFQQVAIGTSWIMPKVSTTREVTSLRYNRGSSTPNAAPKVETQTGYTYIQAEDFDESWINNRPGHKANTGHNSKRLFPEDNDVDITTESANELGSDGSPWGRWYQNHGHSNGNRWAGNDSYFPNGNAPGSVLHDWSPGGGSDISMSYIGKYTTPGAYDDPMITLENAFNRWTIWADYTFEAEEDCLIDISLAVACHRSAYESVKSTRAYWWGDKSEGGYAIEGYESDPYMALFGAKYTVAVNDEVQRTAWDIAPEYVVGGNGVEFIQTCKDPTKWKNVQEDVNGEKLNSHYLDIFPYAHWADDSDNQDLWGAGWYAFYRDDLIQTSADKGIISQAVADQYKHADYTNIPVKKGRNTIRVTNMGGNSWFDEIRIFAHADTGGINDIEADNAEADGPAEYFDLQGRKVVNPAAGIYIVKRGSKVTKEVIR